MSHIFISYSHKDKKYVEGLEQKLIEEGFNVWIDHRIDYGSQWPKEIQRQLDACDAFIVVLTENAYKSKWVQNEVARADRKGKPFFPLLLKGDPWLSIEATQYVDVTDSSLPPEKFYKRLEKVTARKKVEKSDRLAPAPKPETIQKIKVPKLSINPKIVYYALIGLVILAITAYGVPQLIGFVSQFQVPSSEPAVTPTTTRGVTPTSTIALVTKTPEATNTLVATQPPTPLPSQITDGKGVPMVLVPAGKFTMGSDENDDDEKPAHIVDLDVFYIDLYEVTNVFYKACVDSGDCEPPMKTNSNTRSKYFDNPEFDDYPVIYVNWEMANIYCKWREARLPTEAEWEKAARSPEGHIYPWGEEINKFFANYNFSGGDTTPVGRYESGRSVYKAYDLAGNVWEWVADWYDDEYYGILPENVEDPQGPLTDMEYRVLRGGSFSFNDNYLRTSKRYRKLPNESSKDVGFRCARSATP
jgi:formylglycine-generating enzyme required for sulfatase activity